MDSPETRKRRVVAYIDGFNPYFGLRSKGWQRYYWLDVVKLVQNILESDSELSGVKYFTSQAISPEVKRKRKRQSDYLEALKVISAPEVLYGKYQFETFIVSSQ